MAGFQLPFGVKPVNAVPVDYYSGPYISNVSIQDALDQAYIAIPQGIRFRTMEVRLIVNNFGLKYWFKDGTSNGDLIEFVTSPSSFYIQGGTTQSYNTISDIYRTGSLTIGTSSLNSSKLYIYATQSGAFQLQDGSQGDNYILTTSGTSGVATWTSSTSPFYVQGGTTYSTDTTSNIYRTGSVNIGSGTTTGGRLVVSSNGGTVSLVVDESGNVYNNSRGAANTLFGYRALYSNTIMGYSNTAFGRWTLYSNTDGNSNTAVGLSSLYYNNGNYNTAVGINSLYYNTIGAYNTSIGAFTLLDNTLGNYNTAIGYLSLSNNTTTVNVLGTFSAGNGYTTGTYSDIQLIYATGSTATGYPSATIVVGLGGTISSVTLSTGNKGRGFKDTTTILTAATSSIGNGTGFTIGVSTILSGGSNTSIGHQSLLSNTTGSENVAIGFNSLNSNSTGSKNVAVGRNTLFYNSTGGNNTAIGYYSSFNNTTGGNNTALGHQSLYNAAVSSNNTAIGYQSLYSIIGDSSNNTAIGYHAGHYIISGFVSATLSNWSTYIGSYTRGYAYDTTHEVVIGASAIGNGSYSVTLGNDSITKTILKGNIGIGTASPSTKLHIYATQSGAFRLEDGTQGTGKVLISDSNGVASWTQSSAYNKTIKTITGTTYSLLASDTDVILHYTQSSTMTITIPAGLPTNYRYEGKQLGLGQIIVATGSSVSLIYAASELPKTAEQNSAFAIDWISTDTYMIYGKLALS